MKKDDKLFGKFNDLKNRIGDMLQDEQVELGMVITLLTYMLVDTALYQADIEPAVLIAKFAKNVNDVHELKKKIEEGESNEQTISRTTH